jgi:hypothetical protein
VIDSPLQLYNIKIQRAEQIMLEVRTELLPAADLERYTDSIDPSIILAK